MPWQMAETMARRPLKDAGLSHTQRDIGEDRYTALRRPRKIRFFSNGDRFFKGKKVYITPNRYVTFQDLLDDLTKKLPTLTSLPYGVRQIFTPGGGKKIRDIEDLKDGESYVCGGFETFKPMKYGKEDLKTWHSGRTQAKEQNIYSHFGYDNPGVYSHGAFQPNRLRQTYPRGRVGPPPVGYGAQGGYARPSYLLQSHDNVPMKPKVITVVRYGPPGPRTTVRILLNRRSVQSYEQLMGDIAESFGSRWRGQRIVKLYSLRGKEVNGVSDFFRDDDVFIATSQEMIPLSDAQDIIEEYYNDRQSVQDLLAGWQRHHKKKKHRNVITKYTYNNNEEDLKRDSGIGDSDESYRDDVDNQKVDASYTDKVKKKSHNRHEKDNQNRQKELQFKVQEEKAKAAQDEQERARKRLQKRIQDERKIAEEERRKQNQVLSKKKEDPFKKMDAERREAQRLERERKKAQLKEPEIQDDEEDDPKWRRLEWSQEEEMERHQRSRKDKKTERASRQSKISPPAGDKPVSVSPGREKLTPKVDDSSKKTYVSPSRATLTPRVDNDTKQDVSPSRSNVESKVDQNESTRQSRQSVPLSTSNKTKEDERNVREPISDDRTSREINESREQANASPHKGASSPQVKKQDNKEQGKMDSKEQGKTNNVAGDVVNNNQSPVVAPSSEAKLSPIDNAKVDGAEIQQKQQQQQQQPGLLQQQLTQRMPLPQQQQQQQQRQQQQQLNSQRGPKIQGLLTKKKRLQLQQQLQQQGKRRPGGGGEGGEGTGVSPLKQVKVEEEEPMDEETRQLKQKLAEQKRLREEIIRKKELRRQQMASQRRQQIDQRLSESGVSPEGEPPAKQPHLENKQQQLQQQHRPNTPVSKKLQFQGQNTMKQFNSNSAAKKLVQKASTNQRNLKSVPIQQGQGQMKAKAGQGQVRVAVNDQGNNIQIVRTVSQTQPQGQQRVMRQNSSGNRVVRPPGQGQGQGQRTVTPLKQVARNTA
ncbi:trichohyalin, partial [Lingula anatina]|uniref:Trichohyalin n=1 Tax=Lingula anatina TaxID=7574 RepID=A0A1S3IYX7_LINAN